MFEQTLGRTLSLLAIMVGLAIYATYGGFFAREIVIEIAIIAILAISIDIVAGYGGMVSLFHGALLGLAAYVYGVLTAMFGVNPFLAALIAIVTVALIGTAVAAICSKTTGIFFIMATLAFGQLAYTLIFQQRWLGGDDGFGGIPRLDFSFIGLDMGNSLQFALLCVTMIGVSYVAAAILLRSAFGRILCGIHSNEPRMQALGVTTWLHKTRAFGFSSILAGIAGVLAAQHTQYISPELLYWTVSGEALIIVILGGLGTLIGPVIGAVVFVVLKHEVSDITNYWHIVVGLVLILVVMTGSRGIYGQVEHWFGRKRQRATPTPEPDHA